MQNPAKTAIIVFSVIAFIFFAWFGVRPAVIRNKCSWKTTIGGGVGRMAKQETEKTTRKATVAEYNFCIRNNGLAQ
jgi:hypothetical protein